MKEEKREREKKWLTAKLDRSDTKKDETSFTSSQNEEMKAKEGK